VRGPDEVGVFQASYAVVEWILAVPAILAGILLPIASLAYVNNRDEFQRNIRLFINFIIKLSPLFCVLGFFLSKIILANYSNDYKASYFLGLAASLMIVPLSINYFLGTLLIAGEQKNRALAALACAGILNFILNLAFIARYGIPAAIISLVVCEWICLTIQFWSFKKIILAYVFAELTRNVLIYGVVVPLAFWAVWLHLHWIAVLVLAGAYLLFNGRALISIFEFKPA
jgi:O-antigen/teichoic acid export membrane protein